MLCGRTDPLSSGFGGGPGFSLLLSGALPSQQPDAAGGEKDPGQAACGAAASGTPSAHGGRRTATSIAGVSPVPAEEASGTPAPLLFHAGADLRTGGTGWQGRLALPVGAGAAWHPWELHLPEPSGTSHQHVGSSGSMPVAPAPAALPRLLSWQFSRALFGLG